jgi:signal transduction histidine kinase
MHRIVEHPRLLPAVIVPDPDRSRDGRPPRRSTRDWLVDAAIFLVALASGALFVGTTAEQSEISDGLLAVDLLAGFALCLALWARRRWPVGLALVGIAIGTFSEMSSGAGLALLFTVAVHRRWPVAVGIACLSYATLPIYLSLRPDDRDPAWVMYALVLVILSAVVAWGMFVRARRQLVLSLRDRMRQAESEQQLRVEQARQAERARIAREMHDVLAHRISLLSLHAGALEFRPDASAEEVSRAAGVIRASAHQALEDLRALIGVLLEGAEDEAPPEPPQPTLADLPELLEESRAAGMHVRAELALEDLAAVPDAIGRNALRIVQEGLTNARKHAPGAAVDVRVAGTAGEGLTIEVRNPASVLATGEPEIPGAGTGLVGLTERTLLAGGRLAHGAEQDGDFRLRAWLPWPV